MHRKKKEIEENARKLEDTLYRDYENFFIFFFAYPRSYVVRTYYVYNDKIYVKRTFFLKIMG